MATGLALTACAPSATLEPTDVGTTSATLRASVSTLDAPQTYWFRIARREDDLSSDIFVSSDPQVRTTPRVEIPAKTDERPFSAPVDGLAPDTTYRYALCHLAEDSNGSVVDACGTDTQAFTTAAVAPPAGLSQTPVAGLVTNGRVDAILRTADTTYLGGTFDRVGPATGPAVALSASTAARDAAMPVVTGGNATVSAVLADGAGGWYLGGDFTRVGGVRRRNLVHVRADHSVDAAFAPDPDGPVAALAPAAEGGVYAGGTFQHVGGTVRRRLVELRPDGTATAFDAKPDGRVSTLTVVGDTLWVGGGFFTIGGAARTWAAALSRATGTARAWDPRIQSFGPGAVRRIILTGGHVIVTGDFRAVRNVLRDGIIAVDATTGDPDAAFRPPSGLQLWDAAASADGNTLYLAGTVTDADQTVVRAGGAALDAATGALLPWNPGVEAATLAVAGDVVYLGGSTSPSALYPDPTSSALGAVDARTGAVRDWRPDVAGRVEAIAVAGPTVLAAGKVRSVGMTRRSGLAAVDTRTGVLRSFDPGPGEVAALALSGSTLYAAGFSDAFYGGAAVTAIDTGTAAVRWRAGADGDVAALAATASTVYVGGGFRRIGEQARRGLASLEASTGRTTGWDPNLTARGAYDTLQAGAASALALSGTTLYVAGGFSGVGFSIGPNSLTPRDGLAAFDTRTGGATGWSPKGGGTSVLVVDGTTVYLGGYFTSVNGQPRTFAAAVGTGGAGTLLPFAPAIDRPVTALARLDGHLYLAGAFQRVDGRDHERLARVDAVTGAGDLWDPKLSWDGSLSAGDDRLLALDGRDGTLGVGGIFVGSDARAAPSFAVFGPTG